MNLPNEYPEVYRYYDEYEGDSKPPITAYGIQHGDGWNHLVAGLLDYLTVIEVDVAVVQQKEKFGGLRFYHDGIRHEDEDKVQQALGAIRATENQSFHVCEECGAPGKLRRNGWMKTRCDECYSD